MNCITCRKTILVKPDDTDSLLICKQIGNIAPGGFYSIPQEILCSLLEEKANAVNEKICSGTSKDTKKVKATTRTGAKSIKKDNKRKR